MTVKDTHDNEPDVMDQEESVDIDDMEETDVTTDEEGDQSPVPMLPVRSTGSRVQVHDPLRLYLREISKFPMLEPEEEQELAHRVRDQNDQDAAFRMVSSHLRLVVKIAMDFQRRWMQNVLDLIQEGNVGLMRAVQKFDPDKGIKFSYYASFWIKGLYPQVHHGQLAHGEDRHHPGPAQACSITSARSASACRRRGFDADSATISQNLNVTETQVEEMEQRMGSNDVSLDITPGATIPPPRAWISCRPWNRASRRPWQNSKSPRHCRSTWRPSSRNSATRSGTSLKNGCFRSKPATLA